MKRLLCLLLLFCLPAFASKKPAIVYQDAVLVNFQMDSAGVHCTGGSTTNQTLGGYNTTGSANCNSVNLATYTVSVDGHSLDLRPVPSAAKIGVALLTMGIGAAFFKNSALYGQLPGTSVQIHAEGDGKFLVHVGKRTSEYRLVAAR